MVQNFDVIIQDMIKNGDPKEWIDYKRNERTVYENKHAAQFADVDGDIWENISYKNS